MDSRSETPNANQPARSKVKTRPQISATETAADDTSFSDHSTASELDTSSSTMTPSKTKSKPTHRRFWTFLRPQTQSTNVSNIQGLFLALALAALSIVSIWKESNIYVSSAIWACAAAVLFMFKRVTMVQLLVAFLVSIILVDHVPRHYGGVDAEDVMLWLVCAQSTFTAGCLVVACACRFL